MSTSDGDGMIGTFLERFVGIGRTGRTVRVHHECRYCGTTVSENTDVCPQCGRKEVARIEIS